MTKSVSDVQLVAEVVTFFGPRRSAAVLGYCTMLAVVGVRSREDIVARKMARMVSIETRYRLLTDLRKFRAYMAAKGYAGFDPDEGEVELVNRLGSVEVPASA